MSVDITGGGLSFEATIDGSQLIADSVQLEKSILQLKVKAESLGDALDKSVNTTAISGYRQQIIATEAEITRLNNIGREGFDSMGNAIDQTSTKTGKFEAALGRVTSLSNIGATAVSRLNRQVIGLAVSFLGGFIGAAAIEGLVKWIETVDAFTGRLDQAKQNLLALNEVMADADKDAGKQVAPLKELYDTTQNLNLSMNDRIKAAEQLRDLYPAEFQNSTALAIVNGQLKGSYDDLTASIINTAKASAATSKIGALVSGNLDDQFQIDKNNNVKANRISNASSPNAPLSASNAAALSSIMAENDNLTYQQAITQLISDIKKDTDISNTKPAQNIAIRNNTISYLEQFTTGVTKQAQSLADANELLGENLEKFSNLIAGVKDKAQLDNIKNALQIKLDDVGLAPGAADKLRADLQQVDDLEKQYQVKATPKTKTDPAIALLATQTSVLAQIDALKQKYFSKDEDRNQQAEDAIVADFKKRGELIDAQNIKYTNYLKTHSQAQADAAGLHFIQPLSNVDLSNAEGGLAGRQSVNDDKQDIAAQKAIFTEYEAFKLKAGTDAANKLYAADLKGFDNYIDYLKSFQPTVDELNSADPYVKARANSLNDYLKTALPAAIDAESLQQANHLKDLIIQDQSYNDKRKTLIEKANDDVLTLQKAGDDEGAKQRQLQLNAELGQMDLNQQKEIESYRTFASSVQDLSINAAELRVKEAKVAADAELASGKISQDTYNKIIASINNAQASLKSNQLVNTLAEAGKQLETLGEQISSTNQNFGAFLSGLGKVLVNVQQIKDLTTKITEDGGLAAAFQKDPASAFQLIEIGLSSIISLINGITTASAERQKAETDYYNSVIEQQNQYNLALDEQIRLQYQTAQGSLFFTDTAKELSDAAQAYDAAANQYQQSLTALQQGQAIVGSKNVVNGKNVGSSAVSGATAGAAIGAIVGGGVLSVPAAAAGAVIGGLVGAIAGIFGGKTPTNVLAPLLQTYPALIDANGKFNESLAKTLVANNLVSDATKTLLNNTIADYDEEQTALDQITSTLKDLVGDLSSSISDALVQAFENGTDAAQAFQKAVSDILSSIIQQDLFVAIFGAQLEQLQTKLTADALANDGNTQNEIIADIDNFYKNAQGLVPIYTAGLKAAQQAGATQGLTLFPPATTATTTTTSTPLTGQSITASITEDTGTRIYGELAGIQLAVSVNRDLTMQIVMQGAQSIALLSGINVNTKRTADNTALLSDILITLQGVNKNTGGELGALLRAGGKLGF